MSMKSRVEATRALAYVVAAMFDQAHRASDDAGTQRSACRRRPADPDPQGLVHRDRRRGGFDRHPDPRRHGLHRGNRRGAAPARRAHHHDLRGHHGHPGQRPDRAQGAARRRALDAGAAVADRRRASSSRPATMLSFTRSAHACARVRRARPTARAGFSRPACRTSTRYWLARCRSCTCAAGVRRLADGRAALAAQRKLCGRRR